MIILRYTPTSDESKELTKICKLHGIKWTESNDPIDKDAPVLIIQEGLPSSIQILQAAVFNNFMTPKIAGILVKYIDPQNTNSSRAKSLAKKVILFSIGTAEKVTETTDEILQRLKNEL